MQLSIKVEAKKVEGLGEIPFLKISGTMDQKNIKLLEDIVLEWYGKKIYRIVLDLSRVESINSSGLGLLINLAHQAHEAKGGIRMIHVEKKFKTVFDLLGLGERMRIFDDEQAAINSWKN